MLEWMINGPGWRMVLFALLIGGGGGVLLKHAARTYVTCSCPCKVE